MIKKQTGKKQQVTPHQFLPGPSTAKKLCNYTAGSVYEIQPHPLFARKSPFDPLSESPLFVVTCASILPVHLPI